MKIWVFVSLLGFIVTTGVMGQTCPQEWFAAEFSMIANNTFAAVDAGPDTDNTFFRNVARFTSEEIEADLQNAINFYSTRFGLDYSSEPDEFGVRRFQNTTFSPINFPVTFTATVNSWLRSGQTRSACYPVRTGGYIIRFTSDQILHGTYGGEQGILASSRDGLGYGYFVIDACPQEPLLIRFENTIPDHFDPIDGYSVIKEDVFHRTLGEGLALGTSKTTSESADGSILRYEFRVVVNFPKNEP